jgi:hypothetical protein
MQVNFEEQLLECSVVLFNGREVQRQKMVLGGSVLFSGREAW